MKQISSSTIKVLSKIFLTQKLLI